MKYLKVFGFVAVAVALMAIAGAGTASATVLCESVTHPCSKKWVAKTQLEFTVRDGTEGVWSSTSGNPSVRCTEGILKGTPSTGSESETVKMSVQASDFNWNKGCGGVETKTLEGGELEIHSIVVVDKEIVTLTGNGTVTAAGFAFTTTFLGVSCVYSFTAPTDFGTLTGSGTGDAVLDVNTVFTKKEGGFICPTTVTWVEQFTQVAPEGTALYVVTS